MQCMKWIFSYSTSWLFFMSFIPTNNVIKKKLLTCSIINNQFKKPRDKNFALDPDYLKFKRL